MCARNFLSNTRLFKFFYLEPKCIRQLLSSFLLRIHVLITLIVACSTSASELNSHLFIDINKTVAHAEPDWDDSVNYHSSFHKSGYTVYNDKFIFVIRNHGLGAELWEYDPVTKEEKLISDINKGVGSSNPENFTVFNGKLYFSAYSQDYGRELWVYDNSSGKVDLLRDFATAKLGGDPSSSNPSNLIVHNSLLFFWIDSEGSDIKELWRYDSSENSFQKVLNGKESNFYSHRVFDNQLYIFFNSEQYKQPDLIVIYDDINDKIIEKQPSDLELVLSNPHLQIGNTLYGALGDKLVAINIDTNLVTSLHDNLLFDATRSSFTHYQGSIFFEASKNDSSGFEMYEYDINDKSLALSIEIDRTIDYFGFPNSSSFDSVFVYNDLLYFTAKGQLNNRLLWSYSALTASVSKQSVITDVNTLDSSPYDFTAYGEYVYFVAHETVSSFEASYGIWRLNLAENSVELIKNLDNNYDTYWGYGKPRLLTVDDKLVYYTETKEHVNQLWQYDEKSNNHELLFEEDSQKFAHWSGQLYGIDEYIYYTKANGLHIYNISSRETKSVEFASTSHGVILDNAFYFNAYNAEAGKYEIKSHNTESNVIASLNAVNFIENVHTRLEIEWAANGKLFLSKSDSTQLFYYEPATNRFNEDIIDAPLKLNSSQFTLNNYIYKDTAYFDFDGELGKELYSFDLSNNLLVNIANINKPLSGEETLLRDKLHSNPKNFFAHQDKVYFVASQTNYSQPYRYEINFHRDYIKTSSFVESLLWLYSIETGSLTPLQLGTEREQYQFSDQSQGKQSLYHQGKFITQSLIVKDGVKYGNELLVIDVTQPPSVSIENHDDSFDEGHQITLRANVSDADNDDLTILWEQKSGIEVELGDTSSQQLTIVLPEVSTNQSIEISVTVSDGSVSNTTTTSIQIKNINEASLEQPDEGSGGVVFWLLLVVFLCKLNQFNKRVFN